MHLSHTRARTDTHTHTSARLHHCRGEDSERESDDIMLSDCPQVYIGVFRLCAPRQIILPPSLKPSSRSGKVFLRSRIKLRLFFFSH